MASAFVVGAPANSNWLSCNLTRITRGSWCAPRGPDKIVLPFNRPDLSVNTRPAGLIQEAGNEFIITEDGDGYLEI